MAMNFFKKVITFFSAIWNVILWRKTDKKAKQVSKSKEEEQSGKYSTPTTPEAEKLFVDVPLHSSEANDLSEQEQLLHDRTTAALAPAIAHTNESQPDDSYETKKYSSGVQNFGFEDEICQSLSFFSEPIRDDLESKEPLILPKTEQDAPESKENAISIAEKVDLEAEVDDERVNRGIEGETHTNAELPTLPGDSNPEEITCREDEIPKSLLTALEDCPDLSNLTNLSSKEQREVTVLNDLVKDEPLSESMQPSSDHLCVIPRSKINLDLSYLAIGEEIHLFDHEGFSGTFSTGIEESETNKRAQVVESDRYVQNVSVMPRTFRSLETVGGFVSKNEKIAKKLNCEVDSLIAGSEKKPLLNCGTAEAVFKDGENNHNVAALYDEGKRIGSPSKESSRFESADGFCMDVQNNKNITSSSFHEVGLIGISVSSVQTTPGTCAKDCSSEYLTNYMVKSDSLVNFLPEGETDLSEIALADITQTTKTQMTNEAGKGTTRLKEDCLEEVMCTPKGMLKLSGDHRIDSNDAIEGQKEANLKTAFPMDNFSFEDNLLGTQHLDGRILEESFAGCAITEDSPIFQEIFRTVDSGLEDCETVEALDDGLDGMETNATGRCIAIAREDSNFSPFISDRSEKDWPNESPEVHNPEKQEGRQTSCRLTQLRTFHFDDESECKERLGKNEFQISATPALSFQEGSMRLPSDYAVVEREKRSLHLDSEKQSNTINRFDIDSANRATFFDDDSAWSVTLPGSDSVEITEIRDLNPTASLPFLNAPSSMLDIQDKSCSLQVNKPSHTPFGESINDFYPFIDCSSYLFRIPEEIRKETSFNPCVGAAPSQRYEYSSNTCVESRLDREHEDRYEKKYPNMSALIPKCVGTVPLINTFISEEFNNSGATKLSDACDFNQRPVSQNVGAFWGAHPQSVHHPENHQHALVGYPVSCSENYYEGEDSDDIPTEVYENDQINFCTDPESYSYLNPYGTVSFPLLNPFCAQPSQSTFMHGGSLPSIIFPISPISPTENLPSLMGSEASGQNEQYTIPHRLWGGYTTAAHLQNDDVDEKDVGPVFEVKSLSPMENMSTGTNDDEDFVSNSIPDSCFQLTDNNSLHTVKSKADSYTGSLFCESLRSIISHNTENENIFPSFSCSSVQGCCPSVMIQSCETTLSNDSLPSIILEETNHCIKGVDEDYLATEKFMNDVNTALNESVLDQIQGRVDLHSSLLGRGDGLMSMGSAQSENEDQETYENDDILRNSLGENISINNSKLTLLDGVLRTESGGSLPNPLSNLSSEVDDESSDSIVEYCRQVLNTLMETIFITTSSASDADLNLEITPGTNAEYRENLDEPHLQASPERNLIVQNMIFIEGMTPEGIRQMWIGGLGDGKQHQLQNNVNFVPIEENFAPVNFFEEDVRGDSKNSVDKIADGAITTAADVPNRVGRRNRKKRKKLSDFESENEVETCVSGVTIGDGIREQQEPLSEPNSSKAENVDPGTSKPEGKQFGNGTPQPEAGGEQSANLSDEAELATRKENISQLDDEGEINQEEEEEELAYNSGNPSNSRRRRHRRRKRKN